MIIGISGYAGVGKDTFATMLAWQLESAKHVDPIMAKAGSRRFENYMKMQKLRSKYLDPTSRAVRIKKFATTLKEIVCQATGCTMAQLEDRTFKESDMPTNWDHTVAEARQFLLQLSVAGSINMTVYDIQEADDRTIIEWSGALDYKWERTYREFMIDIGDKLRSIHLNFFVNALMKYYRPYTELQNAWPNWLVSDMRFFNEAKAIKAVGGITIRVNNGKKSPSKHPSERELDMYYFDAVVDNTGSLEDLFNTAGDIVKKFKLSEYANTNICPIDRDQHRTRDQEPGNGSHH